MLALIISWGMLELFYPFQTWYGDSCNILLNIWDNNTHHYILWCNGHIIAFKNHIRITFTEWWNPKLFLRGEIPPSTPLLPRGRPPRPPPLTLIKNEGEEIKNLLSNTIIFFSGQARNTTKLSILFSKYDIYHKTFLKLFNQIKSNHQFL